MVEEKKQTRTKKCAATQCKSQCSGDGKDNKDTLKAAVAEAIKELFMDGSIFECFSDEDQSTEQEVPVCPGFWAVDKSLKVSDDRNRAMITLTAPDGSTLDVLKHTDEEPAAYLKLRVPGMEEDGDTDVYGFFPYVAHYSKDLSAVTEKIVYIPSSVIYKMNSRTLDAFGFTAAVLSPSF